MPLPSKVLVDSSVWINYFKQGDDLLYTLIEEDIVCTNEIILSELLPVLIRRKQHEVIESLNSLEVIPLEIDWSLIRKYQVMNLDRGVNNVGIPDLVILQQVIEAKLSFYTLDIHFSMMKDYLSFELLTAN